MPVAARGIIIAPVERRMPEKDTTLGGSSARRDFPTTIWSEVRAAGDPNDPRHRERLESLLLRYWKPVYGYIRVAWRERVEDAKDLAQGFFTLLLERGHFARLREEKGSFRAYLKTALRHYLIDARRAARARRPAGGELVPLQRDEAVAADDAFADPELAFDRQWVAELLEDAIATLEQTLRAQGKAIHFDVFRIYCLDPLAREGATGASVDAGGERGHGSAEKRTYREVAIRLGIKESDVRNYLHLCRTKLRELLRRRIRVYARDEDEVEQELLHVLGR
jgi:RNA polymerase sigma factor (sigma-70 family)